MGEYEKEQARLEKLMEGCLQSWDSEEEFDDERKEDEDNISVFSQDSDTEQEISDTKINLNQSFELADTSPYFIGMDVTKSRKRVPPRNRPTRQFCVNCKAYVCLEHSKYLCSNCLDKGFDKYERTSFDLLSRYFIVSIFL
ncbi:unnamed protein product [Acanthoscelides obtectus]|uniref:Uncharacterized protein n=1 Tax=Acanthoscelides obtectus TaxID=200917 RepID=A0A9P0PSA1_ACAOB|nr:unnamed protein product [Acanthoscelides obtectus]CAK1679501.1 hypothetical protein AOBTE_LOCUS32301 [Acanthoscelides obtectus]